MPDAATKTKIKVLVADDDDTIVDLIRANLEYEGIEVLEAFDGWNALNTARESLPDLILLDVMMPLVDGFEVCRRLRADRRLKHIPVILVTAKCRNEDRVFGLEAGADDFVSKPFDPVELVARVKSSLRRFGTMRAVNPLTQLPGNSWLQEELVERVQRGSQFALLHCDLDHFKAFNDHYGFLRGDRAIRLLADVVQRAVDEMQDEGGFVGHIGGDDVVAIVDADKAEDVAKKVIRYWDAEADSLYDPVDIARGYIEVLDRRKELRRFPVSTVSIGISSNKYKPILNHWQASDLAAEMKHVAKKDRGSSYAIDRRKDPFGE